MSISFVIKLVQRWRAAGAVWLDATRSLCPYIDKHVTIDGIRSGFDLLDVHRIWLARL